MPHLPRRPDTLAGVMSYLCASAVVDEVEGWDGVKDFRERVRRRGSVFGGGGGIAGRRSFTGGARPPPPAEGRRYGYGMLVGLDGGRRWAVDWVD